ncbi:hypothetical protein [Actinacidiphila acidipaludis]|uniref:Uncharacterized protein n=1 Tax=Actinacidiphila acidipaludis TaxID=2873382 RepID=A0ABS7Q952_9ACTN|nr:hypothetical protein [Streptomyces acidipaludis]MBY8879697.1 hypothetical protein [Streptomyces acidipaludis]
MISEPEMNEGSERGAGADVLSGGGPAAGGRRTGARPAWRWVLAGFAAACVLGTAVWDVTGYGRTSAPDLHGYHVGAQLCTAQHLQPLTDAMAAQAMVGTPLATRRGSAVDHTACLLSGSVSHGDGWTTDYLVSLTVDLHKKDDPRAEFDDAVRVAAASPTPGAAALPAVLGGEHVTVRPYAGMGDRAYLATSTSRQSLSVLQGGAVLSLSVEASNAWEEAGRPPAGGNDVLPNPRPADTTALRGALPAAMRVVMSTLTQ